MKENSQIITLVDRSHLTITGALGITAFDEGYIALNTEVGAIIIEGEEMEIEDLSSEKKTVKIKGKINLIEYRDTNQKRKGFLFAK